MNVKKIISGVFIFVLIAFVGSAAIFNLYSNSNRNRIIRQNMEFCKDTARVLMNTFEKNLMNTEKMIQQQATEYAKSGFPTESPSIFKVLQNINRNTVFSQLDFAEPDGMNYSSISAVSNIYNYDYFQKALIGESGFTHITDSLVTDNHYIGFYAPVRDNNLIKGVLVGVYNDDALIDIFSELTADSSIKIMILENDGKVIVNTDKSDNTKNLLNKAKEYDFSNKTYINDIYRFIENDNIKEVSFVNETENGPEITTILTFEQSDWLFSVSISPENTQKIILESSNSGYPLIIVVMTDLFILLIFFVVLDRIQRARLNDEIDERYDELKQNFRKLTLANDEMNGIIKEIGRDVKAPVGKIVLLTRQAARSMNDRDFCNDCFEKISKTSSQIIEMIDEKEKRRGSIKYFDEEVFCSISGTLRDAVKNIRPRVNAKKQNLVLEITSLSHDVVRCSKNKIMDIFNSVIVNMVEASEPGEKITLSFTEYPFSDAEMSKYVLYADNAGEGITPEYIRHLFVPNLTGNSEGDKSQDISDTENPFELVTDMMGGNISVYKAEDRSAGISVIMYFAYSS